MLVLGIPLSHAKSFYDFDKSYDECTHILDGLWSCKHAQWVIVGPPSGSCCPDTTIGVNGPFSDGSYSVTFPDGTGYTISAPEQPSGLSREDSMQQALQIAEALDQNGWGGDPVNFANPDDFGFSYGGEPSGGPSADSGGFGGGDGQSSDGMGD